MPFNNDRAARTRFFDPSTSGVDSPENGDQRKHFNLIPTIYSALVELRELVDKLLSHRDSVAPKTLLTTGQFAKLTGFKPKEVQRMCVSGELHAFKRKGRGQKAHWRIPVSELEAFLTSNRRGDE